MPDAEFSASLLRMDRNAQRVTLVATEEAMRAMSTTCLLRGGSGARWSPVTTHWAYEFQPAVCCLPPASH